MQTQDRVGQQFGNYRLTHLIGEGGYAEVYLAQNIRVDSLQYAIKILTGTNLKAKQREEFLAEARTVANLKNLSSHIVQIHDFGVQPAEDTKNAGISYLVMEYAPGGTLRTLYPHGTRMPFERIILYVNQVAEALQCAHDQKPSIIHCDVKPENMLLRSRDHLLLSDFGIATTGRTSVQTVPTREMTVVGTATYMAPERLSARQTGRASDQYSLGVVVYEWLCGFPPFEGLDMEICYKHMTEPPPGLSEEFPDITPEIEAVVMRALKKKPADRYPTVIAFARALESAIQHAIQQNHHPWQLSSKDPVSLQPGDRGQKALPQDIVEPTLPRPWPIVMPPSQKAETTNKQAPSSQPSPVEQAPVVLPEPPSMPVSPNVILLPSQSPALPLHEAQTLLAPPARTKQKSEALPRRSGPSAVTEPFIRPDRRPRVSRSPARPIRKQRASAFFGVAPQFIQEQGHGSFIYSGIIFNVLSAILLGRLWSSFLFLFAGLIFSLVTLWLTIIMMESVLATCFAILNAAYWLMVGWSIGSFLATLLHLNPRVPPAFTAIVFFGVSLGLNIRYVTRKKF